jgi:predicted MPP superfamily phosphohydrolase
MFGAVLTAVITVLHIYVFWRASTILTLARFISNRSLFIMGALMWILFVIGRFWGHDNPGLLAGLLEHLTMCWMATLFLCTVCLLVVDVVTAGGRLWSSHTSLLRGLGLVSGLILTTMALVQGLRPPVVESYEVSLAGLPKELDGTVIVAISDLHLGSRTDEKWLSSCVGQIESERPDLIFLLGDIFEGNNEPAQVLSATLSKLKAPLGVWAVLGNHEFHRGGESQSGAFSANGFTVLRNGWAEVKNGLVLTGVDDLTNGQRNGHGSAALKQALSGRPQGTTILLSHSPLYAGEAAEAGVALMLSGHTHGGQIWPFGYLVQQKYPLLEGRYQEGKMAVIVCRGTGTWGPRMRLWAPGEILRVTLHASTGQG